MKKIERPQYLEKLINKMHNGDIKVISGIRRCGKSYMLDPIFTEYLSKQGIKQDHIIKIELDRPKNKKYWNSEILEQYILSKIKDKKMYYIILDEIQLVENFSYLLSGLTYEKNLDIYVTGSNSKFLSGDILTEFRGRGDQIHLYPLSFAEYCSAHKDQDITDLFQNYITYGGLPFVTTQKNDEDKSKYLKEMFEYTYIKDIIERNKIKKKKILDDIVNMLASSIGSLTNPQKLHNTFISKGIKELSINTINSYLTYLENSFLINKAYRYDIKGKKYISSPQKYYFTDLGLRNARLNFRQQEENHLMENLIYNELRIRGYNVDIGVIEKTEEGHKKKLEIDFVCNCGNFRYYIQSALNIDSDEKYQQECKSLINIRDNFKKIIIVKSDIKKWYNDKGIIIMGIKDFLLNADSLNF